MIPDILVAVGAITVVGKHVEDSIDGVFVHSDLVIESHWIVIDVGYRNGEILIIARALIIGHAKRYGVVSNFGIVRGPAETAGAVTIVGKGEEARKNRSAQCNVDSKIVDIVGGDGIICVGRFFQRGRDRDAGEGRSFVHIGDIDRQRSGIGLSEGIADFDYDAVVQGGFEIQGIQEIDIQISRTRGMAYSEVGICVAAQNLESHRRQVFIEDSHGIG